VKHTDVFKLLKAKPIGPIRQAWDADMLDGSRLLVLWFDQKTGLCTYKALNRIRTGKQRGAGAINRLTSLQMHMNYDTPLFALLAKAVDPTKPTRTVKEVVPFMFPIERVSRDDEHWYATLGIGVPL